MGLIGRMFRQWLRVRWGERPGARYELVDDGQLDGLRLEVCRLDACDGACCRRGARMSAGEAARIEALVLERPELFDALPRLDRYLVPRDAVGQSGAFSTEVVSDSEAGRRGLMNAWMQGRPVTPADMRGSRCVFLLADARCVLQTAAEVLGKHKWTYKPLGCWLFPLKAVTRGERGGRTLVRLEHAPASEPALADYPCARPRGEGASATVALREEIEYFRRVKCARR